MEKNYGRDMLQLNYRIVKKLRSEIETSGNADRVDTNDFVWINELTHKGYITPLKKY